MSSFFNKKLILIFGNESWTFQGNAELKRFFKDHLLCLINIPSHPDMNTQDAVCLLSVHVKWLKQQLVGADINWALLSNPKGRNGEARKRWTAILQTQGVHCKACQSAHLQTVNRGSKTFFTYFVLHIVKLHLVFVWLTVCFLDCFRMPHPSSSEGLIVWYWLLLVSLPVLYDTHKNLSGFVKLTISAAKVQRTENLGGWTCDTCPGVQGDACMIDFLTGPWEDLVQRSKTRGSQRSIRPRVCPSQ